jgi:hypothetical protein
MNQKSPTKEWAVDLDIDRTVGIILQLTSMQGSHSFDQYTILYVYQPFGCQLGQFGQNIDGNV